MNYLYYLYERPDQEDQHDANISNSDKDNENVSALQFIVVHITRTILFQAKAIDD